jgi:phage major head subunit gpT-like protein
LTGEDDTTGFDSRRYIYGIISWQAMGLSMWDLTFKNQTGSLNFKLIVQPGS